MINGLKNLLYLDDKPVKELDRLAAEAYMTGGREAEQEVRKQYLESERQRIRSYVKRNSELEEEAKKKKQLQIESIKRDIQIRKSSLLSKRDNLREMIRTARLNAEERQNTEWAIEAVDQELGSDFFNIMNDDEIVVPQMRRVSDGPNQPEEEGRRRERREKEQREREQREYEERERVNLPKAGMIIPEVKESGRVKTKAERMRDEGVVVSTDSECENDPTLFAKRAGYRKEIFKWTPFYEEKLEELLIKYMFDFVQAAQEFSGMVNNFEDTTEEDKFYYEITPKILQMKWTDVEIKNFRMAEFTKDEEEDEEYLNRENGMRTEVEEFGTDEPVRTYKQEKDFDSSKSTESNTMEISETKSSISSVNKFHDFSSSSDDDCTNLEELD